MAFWRVVYDRPFESEGQQTYEGTDTSGGFFYRLEHTETGEEREFRILFSRGPSRAGVQHVAAVLRKYLDEPDPPMYVTLDREGSEIPR